MSDKIEQAIGLLRSAFDISLNQVPPQVDHARREIDQAIRHLEDHVGGALLAAHEANKPPPAKLDPPTKSGSEASFGVSSEPKKKK